MGIDEFRGLIHRVDGLEPQIVAIRKGAESIQLSGKPKSQFLTRLISELQSSVEDRRQINFAFVTTPTEMEYLSHLVMYMTAIPEQIADILKEIESALMTDELLCKTLTPDELSWITERIGSFEILKHTDSEREFRGDLPLLHLSIVRQFLHKRDLRPTRGNSILARVQTRRRAELHTTPLQRHIADVCPLK